MSLIPEDAVAADKVFRQGARRAVHPDETFARLAPLLPVFGITRVAGIGGLDRVGVPVFTAVRPNARSLAVYQGKGVTRSAARVSAVMEAVETWCAESIDQPLLFNSIDEIRFSRPIAPLGKLPLASLDPLDTGLPFLWIEGERLIGGGPMWLPFELVHANYALPEPAHSATFAATTNGLASGNTRDEALLHGLCEVIERDAVTLWKLGSGAWSSSSAIRLDTIEDPTARGLLDRFAEFFEVALFDATSDLGIPCVVALVAERAGEVGAPEIGCGCHPAPDVAICRALTEAAQARVTFIAGAREDIPVEDYGETAVAARREDAAAVFAGLAPTRDARSIVSRETPTLAGDVAEVLRALDAAGLHDAVAVDVSKRGLPFSVMRVVVPGLEGALEGPRSEYVPGARATRILTAEAA